MAAGFLANLKPHELRRLREVIKKTHMAYWPERHKTDRECDKIIEALGPEIMERRLKQACDTGIVATGIYIPNTYRKRAG